MSGEALDVGKQAVEILGGILAVWFTSRHASTKGTASAINGQIKGVREIMVQRFDEMKERSEQDRQDARRDRARIEAEVKIIAGKVDRHEGKIAVLEDRSFGPNRKLQG